MDKKLAIITGASRGIGFQLAKLLLENQYQIVSISRNKVDLPNVISIRGDLNDFKNEKNPSWLNELTESKLLSKYERISLIHNAGFLRKDSVQNLEYEDFFNVLAVNVLAPQRLNEEIIPFMKEGSSIIYVGSTLSEKAVKNSFSYVTSKHAVSGMMKATCQDLAGTGIHTSLICPGFTDTEMLRDHVGNDESVIEMLKGKMTLNRLIAPLEIAKLIHFAIENPISNGAIWHGHLGQVES